MDYSEDQRQLHRNYPTGLFSLLEPDYAEYVLSSIIESPPNHLGTVDNLQRRSGVPSPHLESYLEHLETVGIIERDRTGEDDTYEIQDDSEVLDLLVELNSALNATLSESATSIK